MEGRWTCRCGRENPEAFASCPRCGRQIQVAPRAAAGSDERQSPPPSPAPPARAGRLAPSPPPEAAAPEWPSPVASPARPGSGGTTRAPSAKPIVVGVVGALAVVLALVIGAVAVRSLTAPDKKKAPAGTAANPTAASFDSLEQVVVQLQGFVERARGLQFKTPVKVTILKDAPFLERLRASPSPDVADLLGQEATLRALRLLPDEMNLAQQTELDLERVLGFYDPATKELYVKGVGTTPYVRYVLVHELTHALQDQQFDLTRLGADNNDAALAARAVVEGDAERTMRSYLSTLTTLEQDAIQREARARQDDIYNQAYYTSFDNFPYVVGMTWNDVVRGQAGQGALDDAFRTFPRSTAEIMHPDRYLAGVGPTDVAPPAADGPIVDQGVVGEYQLVYLLARAIDDQDAFDIAQAWGGSRFVTWKTGNRSCTRARFTMLSAEADRVLAQALSAWAETTDASVEGTGPVVLTACNG